MGKVVRNEVVKVGHSAWWWWSVGRGDSSTEVMMGGDVMSLPEMVLLLNQRGVGGEPSLSVVGEEPSLVVWAVGGESRLVVVGKEPSLAVWAVWAVAVPGFVVVVGGVRRVS